MQKKAWKFKCTLLQKYEPVRVKALKRSVSYLTSGYPKFKHLTECTFSNSVSNKESAISYSRLATLCLDPITIKSLFQFLTR